MNFRRKRPKKGSVGCRCCHILRNNSEARTKPKDRYVDEETTPSMTRRRKAPRPFKIEIRWTRSFSWRDSGWSKYRGYRNERERADALRSLNRGFKVAEYRAA